jgi:hypothetical protein
MPIYFGLWKANLSIQPPANSVDQIARARAFLELIKVHLKSGMLKEAYGFLEGDAGYFVTGDISDEQVAELLAMWSPFVTFELRRTIPAPRFNEILLSATEKRAGQH